MRKVSQIEEFSRHCFKIKEDAQSEPDRGI